MNSSEFCIDQLKNKHFFDPFKFEETLIGYSVKRIIRVFHYVKMKKILQVIRMVFFVGSSGDSQRE